MGGHNSTSPRGNTKKGRKTYLEVSRDKNAMYDLTVARRGEKSLIYVPGSELQILIIGRRENTGDDDDGRAKLRA